MIDLATVASPVDLMRAAGVEPPSPAIEAILDALYAAPPTAEQRRRWRSLSRMPWPSRKARRAAACIGRRGLKTSGILAWACVTEALSPGHDAYAAPGSRIYAVVIAPKLAQSREAVRGIRAALDALAPLGVAYELRDAAGTPEIVLTSPAFSTERVITVMTADAVSVRGFAVCFAAFDEAGFLPSEEWLAQRDVDLVRAVAPAMVQFPGAMMLFASSPGRPGSVFHSLVDKPRRDDLVVRAPTWVTHPTITEAVCLRDAGGDAEVFEREYAASKFGAAGESFLSSAAVWRCLGSEQAGIGPQPGGSYVIGLDVAQLRDQTAIVVCSSFETEIGPAVAPVRHVRVDLAEVIQGSKKDPTPIEAIAARVRDLSRAFGDAPVVFDPFQGPTVKGALHKLGMREHADASPEAVPRPNTFCQRSMAPQHQTPRWRGLRQLVDGARLHLRADDEALAKQLVELKATQLSSGSLKVEGRRDDLADALALAAEVALRLPPTGGPNGHISYKADGLFWDESGLHVRNGRWARTMPGGREVRAAMPEWAEGFAEHAADLLRAGTHTPGIDAWLRRQPEHVQRELLGDGVSVPITHD